MPTYDAAAAIHAANHAHGGSDDLTTLFDDRYVRFVNSTGPDESGNVVVSGGGGGGGLDTPMMGASILGTGPTPSGDPFVWWDGLDNAGNPMPAGFDHLEVVAPTVDVSSILTSGEFWGSAWPDGPVGTPWALRCGGSASASGGVLTCGSIGTVHADISLLEGHPVGTDFYDVPLTIVDIDPGVPSLILSGMNDVSAGAPVFLGISGDGASLSCVQAYISGGQLGIQAFIGGVAQVAPAPVQLYAPDLDPITGAGDPILIGLIGHNVVVYAQTAGGTFLLGGIDIGAAAYAALGSHTRIGFGFATVGQTSTAAKVYAESSSLVAKSVVGCATIQRDGDMVLGTSYVNSFPANDAQVVFSRLINQVGHGGAYSPPVKVRVSGFASAKSLSTISAPDNAGNTETLPAAANKYVQVVVDGVTYAIPLYLP